MTDGVLVVVRLLRKLGPRRRAVEALLRRWEAGERVHLVGVANGNAGEAQLLLDLEGRDYMLIVTPDRFPLLLADAPFPDGIGRLVPEGVTAGDVEGGAIPPLLLLHLSLGGQVSLSERWAREGC